VLVSKQRTIHPSVARVPWEIFLRVKSPRTCTIYCCHSIRSRITKPIHGKKTTSLLRVNSVSLVFCFNWRLSWAPLEQVSVTCRKHLAFVLISLYFTLLWLKKKIAPLFQSLRSTTRTNLLLFLFVFYLLLFFFCPLFIARVYPRWRLLLVFASSSDRFVG